MILVLKGVSVPSNVSDQPMSSEETLTGAENRAKNAKTEAPESDYWVGIEGGIEKIDGFLRAFAWVVVIDKKDYVSRSRTAEFTLPKKVADLIEEGYELGDADDIVFKRSNSKQEIGSVGILTHDVLTRTSFYEPAVILALIPFVNPDLY